MARRRRGAEVNGWLVLDKPLGMSSSRAVGAAQRIFDAKKAGHGGTLDPLATGVLPIAFGEATKTVAFAMDGAKTYRFTVRLGIATASEDAEGEVVAESPVRPADAAVDAILPRFTGTILQVPPAFSALKIDGQRAYALARAGTATAPAARPVEIRALRLLARPDADHVELEAETGKGAYVRSLARDIAAALGTVGHVAALRRTRVGGLRIEQAISLENLTLLGHSPAVIEHLLPIETVLDDIPALALTEAEATRLRHGEAIPLDAAASRRFSPSGNGVLVRASAAERLVALAEVRSGQLRPVRVINL